MKLRCLVVALALLAAFASDSWGQSRRNPPEKTTPAQQPAAPDQRGTEQSPLVVKSIPTPKTHEETAADEAEKKDKSNSDWWLVKLTGVLAGIGFLQLIVFAWQGIQLRRAVTVTKEATNLAKQEFTATHRPKVIVHGMDVKLAGDGELRRVNFRYVNAGDTDAFVTSISSRILWTKHSMVPADIEFTRHDVIKDPILVPSGKNGFAITPDEVNFVTLVRSGRGGHDTAYCVGVIVYRDTNDIERRTGFCRRYDSERERWLKAEDEDHEYSY